MCYKKYMQKKEIYEHLADIYLSTSNKNKKPRFLKKPANRYIFAAGIFLMLCITLLLNTHIHNRGFTANKDIALIIEPSITWINFNFDSAKKEVLNFNLAGLNLKEYKSLGFALRNATPKTNLHLRVELRNGFGESAELYLKDISSRWRDFEFGLAEFKNITVWSNMSELMFVIEEWNTEGKTGKVYIDNVRFLK
ncbi:MAG: hypothetical protein ABH914_04605 [Candidatus Omnitrophota bacterium]